MIPPKVCYAVSVEERSTTYRLLCHYSDWFRLKKAVAWMLRFKKYLQGKGASDERRKEAPETRSRTRAKKEKKSPSLLSSTELQEAEKAIIQYVQRKTFKSELQSLRSRDSAEIEESQKGRLKKSQLRKMNPMLVDGVVVVGGRLAMAPVSDSVKQCSSRAGLAQGPGWAWAWAGPTIDDINGLRTGLG